MLDASLLYVKENRICIEATEPILFQVLDLHVRDGNLDIWKGKVKKKLKTDLGHMGIQVSKNDKLLDIVLKAQPCSSDDNYKFKAMLQFISQTDDDLMVRIVTDSGESKEFDVLELTRWCTDNAERIAMELHAL